MSPAAPSPLLDLDPKVVRKAREAEDICSFELARADGGALPPFSAGSHIDVQRAL